MLKGLLVIIITIVLSVAAIVSIENSDWATERKRVRDATAAQEATPHVIREADGCKVYAFKAGDRYHYFTRCASSTTTDSSYTVDCGKNCKKTETEVIETTTDGKW